MADEDLILRSPGTFHPSKIIAVKLKLRLTEINGFYNRRSHISALQINNANISPAILGISVKVYEPAFIKDRVQKLTVF